MVKIYLASFLCALAATALLTPAAGALARRFGVLDAPDPRKVHRTPVPRWGGLAIFGGTVLSLAAVWAFLPRFRTLLAYRERFFLNGEAAGLVSLGNQFAGILLGGALVFLLGAWDDRRPLPAVVKLLVQIIAAYCAMDFGVRMAGLALPGFGFLELPILASQAVTLAWLLGFMNIVNLADGLDGLAAGIAAIAAMTFLAVCALQGESRIVLYAKQMKLAAVLSAALGGAAVGFLFHNFYPAKIFMGDGGALFLGFMLGAVSILGTLKTSALVSLVLPLLVVALPASDAAFALVRRYRAGRGLMEADRGHFHHRLLERGWTQREVVFLAYVLTLLLSTGAILLAVFNGRA
jgi:UDP-GlcNAc:undecaprenyl-phosphate/decaprenyl-phosphate GlcNAc-1-phosphate transferase